MKKIFTAFFILSVMLLTINDVNACTKACKCGCNKKQQCTCIKDKKGNIFRAEIVNLAENEKKLRCNQIKECSDSNSCSLEKCKKTKKCKLLFWKKCKSDCENQ